jgi:hypothetical protein
MTAQHASGLVSRAVREALGSMVSPERCEQVIARSLAAHGLDAIPEVGEAIGTWLEGPLRAEVEAAVGADAAELLVAQLGPIAAYAAVAKLRPSASAEGQAARSDAPKSAERKSAPEGESRSAPTQATAPLPRGAALEIILDSEDETQPHAGTRTPCVPRPAQTVEQQDSACLRATVAIEGPAMRADNAQVQVMPVLSVAAAGGGRSAFSTEAPTASFGRPPAMTIPAPGGTTPLENAALTMPPACPVNDVMAQSGRKERRTTMPDRPLETGSEAMPIVLTATSHMGDLGVLQRYLSGMARVIHVRDFVGLLDAIDTPGHGDPIVLIDCQRPTVHITSVTAIGEDLPRGTTVVLWGADEHTWQQVDRDRSPACRWVRCSSEATPHDVGSLCSMLLG